MTRFLLRRFVLSIITMIAVSMLAFMIMEAPPGDYVSSVISGMEATGTSVSKELAQQMRKRYGLDKPVYVRYARWIWRVLQGDFGRSQALGLPVTEAIGDRLALTLSVSLAAMVVSWGIALPIGIYSAVHRYSVGDYIATILGFMGLAIPNFLLALLLLYAGYRYFDTDVGGLFSPEFRQEPWTLAKVGDLLQHIWIPAIVLGLSPIAGLIRVMRANLLDELGKPYVVTARAKGLPEWRVILKYPVRMALNPFASFIGYWLPALIGSGTIVSVVLSLPTLGPIYLSSLVQQDMFLAGAIVLLLGILTVIGTFLSDVLLMVVDPRIRIGGR